MTPCRRRKNKTKWGYKNRGHECWNLACSDQNAMAELWTQC